MAAHMVTTQLDAADTLRIVAATFGLESARKEKAELLLDWKLFRRHCGRRQALSVGG